MIPLLSALTKNGRKISLVNDYSVNELKAWRSSEQFFCDGCGAPLTLKLGERVAWHFAHKAGARCDFENEPESAAHRRGKASLYRWLRSQNAYPVVEHYFPAIRQRADLSFLEHDPPLVFEYQCSTLAPDTCRKRNHGYRSLGFIPIWILAADRYNKTGAFFYRWSQTDALMIGKNGVLIYFNPKTRFFHFLHHIWAVGSAGIIAAETSIHASELTPKDLLTPKINDSINILQAWVKQKQRWRTIVSPNAERAERYVRAICVRNGLGFHHFPPYVGLPLTDHLTIATSPHLWQAWLILNFMWGKVPGTVLSLQAIQSAFSRLVKKAVFQLRTLASVKASPNATLKAYVEGLARLSLLRDLGRGRFQLQKNIVWEPRELSDFIDRDARTLALWIKKIGEEVSHDFQ
ncbi:competence protein CoiA [Camelliibacillus cellulosilyticus]|uniref:Competence protein CoiA n=1 Tax=Camelliibacillus cellulosilyticus TaxID=2174486 RepID=A0ABV9GPF5_9BACL